MTDFRDVSVEADLLGLMLHAQEIGDEQLIAEHAIAMQHRPRTREQHLALDVLARELGLRHAPEPDLERVRRRRREARDALFPPTLEVVPDPDDAA